MLRKKSTGYPHYTCCGLKINITSKNQVNLTCIPIPNTKSAKSISKEVLEKEAKYNNATLLDFQCPANEDAIQGSCEEFSSIMVNDQNDCLKLSESEKDNVVD